MERVIVDVSRTVVRILATDGAPERPRLRLARIEPIGGALDVDTLRRALRGLHRTRTKTVIVTIPREEVMTRLVRLPAPGAARQAGRPATAQFPFPHDQLVTDIQSLGHEQGTDLAQVVACPRPRLQTRLALLQELGWEPDIMTPASWGLWSWCRRSMEAGWFGEPAIVLHLDVDRTDVIMMDGDLLVFSRGLPDAIAPSVEEIERTLTAAATIWPQRAVSRLVVTGMGDLEEWKRILERRLAVPVLVRPPSDQAHASLIVAWGAAMAERRWLVNLAPKDVQRARHRHRYLRRGVLTGSLLCAALALGDGLLAGLVRRHAHAAAEANEALRQWDTIAGDLRQQEHSVAVLEAFLVSHRRTRTAVAELFHLTPADVVFEELAFDRARQELMVRGSTATTARVMDYLHLLEESGAWSHAALRYAISRRAAAEVRTDFEILLTGGAS